MLQIKKSTFCLFLIGIYLLAVLIIKNDFLLNGMSWSHWFHISHFFKKFFTLNPFSALNFYLIDGKYHYIELKNIFTPILVFIPIWCMLTLYFEKNNPINFWYLCIGLPILFWCVQVLIGLIAIFVGLSYTGTFDIWEILWGIIWILFGFYGCKAILCAYNYLKKFIV